MVTIRKIRERENRTMKHMIKAMTVFLLTLVLVCPLQVMAAEERQGNGDRSGGR